MLVVVGCVSASALVLGAMIGRGRWRRTAAGGAEKVQPVKVMAADAHPAFEVAAIKPSDPSESANGFHAEGRQVSIANQTLVKMVMFCIFGAAKARWRACRSGRTQYGTMSAAFQT